jgi:PhnB protein
MKLNPYLTFDGRCEQAFKFYEKCLGAKILMMHTFEGSPAAAQAPPGWGKKIMHGRMSVGDDVLMGSDATPEHYQSAKGITVTLGMNDPAEAERVFHALAENGKVNMPIQETFWAARFGMLVDQFGIPWMVNCEKPAA